MVKSYLFIYFTISKKKKKSRVEREKEAGAESGLIGTLLILTHMSVISHIKVPKP